jgi:hypothetical protein
VDSLSLDNKKEMVVEVYAGPHLVLAILALHIPLDVEAFRTKKLDLLGLCVL